MVTMKSWERLRCRRLSRRDWRAIGFILCCWTPACKCPSDRLQEAAAGSRTYCPFSSASFTSTGRWSLRFCHVRVVSQSTRSFVADFRLLDSDGRVLAEIERFRFQAVDFDRVSAPQMLADEWQISEDSVAISAGSNSSLPGPSEVAASTSTTIAALVEQADRHGFYRSISPALDRLCGAYAIRALAALGAAQKPFSIDELIQRGGVAEEQRRLLGRLVEMCLEDGFFQRVTDDDLLVADNRELPDPSPMWRHLMLDCPGYSAELILLGRAGTHLPAVLRGEENPLQIIFPQRGSAPRSISMIPRRDVASTTGSPPPRLRKSSLIGRQIDRFACSSWELEPGD